LLPAARITWPSGDLMMPPAFSTVGANSITLPPFADSIWPSTRTFAFGLDGAAAPVSRS
jgi:hypothetical protein